MTKVLMPRLLSSSVTLWQPKMVKVETLDVAFIFRKLHYDSYNKID